MSELISGKEAWIKAVNGESVQYNLGMQWEDLTGRELNYWQGERFLNKDLNYKFRLKPRTIKLNGVEVPCCGKNHKAGKRIWILCGTDPRDYCSIILDESDELPAYWWDSEDNAKQVVAALRSVFNEKTKEGDPS